MKIIQTANTNLSVPPICLMVAISMLIGSAITAFPLLAAEPVTVTVGPEAPELEQFAAHELCGYLQKLYGIRTSPVENDTVENDTVENVTVEKFQVDAGVAILIGSPKSNPNVAKALGAAGWPQVTDQGIVLKRAELDGRPALVVGGGSPQATLWAVYELVERWGVRYLLHGDVLPDDAGEFQLPKEDVTIEPKLRVRQWRVVNDFACGPESWGMADYRPVLDQLAKLKFNRILVSTWTYQPFLHFEHKGVARRSAGLWFHYKYPITDDMVGRNLFSDMPEFWNPDLPYGASYKELAAAGEKLLHNIMGYAHKRGMQSLITARATDFPKEFEAVLPGSRAQRQLGAMSIVPGNKTGPSDPDLTGLSAAVLKATVNTYPEADYVVLGMPEHRQWEESYKQAWKELDDKYGIGRVTSVEKVIAAAGRRPGAVSGHARCVREAKGDIVMLRFYDRLLNEQKVLADTKRPKVKLIYRSVAEELFPILAKILPPDSETLNFIAYTPARVVQRREAIGKLDTSVVPATLIYTLHDDNVGLLPALATGSLHELTKDLRRHGWAGFSTRYWLIGDHDACLAYIAKAAWDEKATPEAVYRDQVRAACGTAAVEDMLTMFKELEAASIELEWHALSLGFPVPGMMMKHWNPGPMPDSYVKIRNVYRRALE
ncbi:MAG: hypothetical protein U9N87_08495, partial [Planctomycetota bacterium]|nr:hypothetical protein [Planctomycetota bacterium]